MKKAIWLGVAMGVLLLSFNACKKDDPQPQSNYVSDWVTHWGYDFSAELSDTINFMNDADIITWYPRKGGTDDPLYFRNVYSDPVDGKNIYKKMSGTLESIRSIPAVWDEQFVPMAVGDVYVAKCMDGYVKFQVLELNPLDWEVKVKYLFTTGSTWAE